MIEETEDYKLGQQLFHEGLRYSQIPTRLGKSATAAVYSGFEVENKVTKCGFSKETWCRVGGYKTSSDLSTLF